MDFKTISSLALSEHWRGAQSKEIALRQGDLDGACGLYALMMALLATGVVKRKKIEDIWDGDFHGRTKFAEWVRIFDALVSKGTKTSDLLSLFEAFNRLLKTSKMQECRMIEIAPSKARKTLATEAVFSSVRKHIDEYDTPALMILDWTRDHAHWIVAVGYQLGPKQKNTGKQLVANILTLDSSSSISSTCVWNGLLGRGYLGDRKLRYLTEDDSRPTVCSVSTMIGLVRHKNSRR
jgi:hypothetical protein